jgi:diguanylate cyclase (GGDEF)-like protein
LNQVEVSRLSLELKKSQLQSKQFQEDVEKLEHDSSHDHLTGAGNRRHLDRVLSENWSSNSNETQINHLAMLDIDDFKKVNDNFSHKMGEEILQQTAKIIQIHLGENDLLFRSGGEEFVMLIKGKSRKKAINIYENIRHSIENYNWQNFHKDVSVTATLGMVSHTETQRIKRALHGADERMYHGKIKGKNRLIDKI